MHRQPLLTQLIEFRKSPLYKSTHRASYEKMMAFLEETPNCFLRSHLKGHFTASCWLWDSEKKAALLCHHKKLKKWLQLGGHADGDPLLLEVALKEAKEESGFEKIISLTPLLIDIDIHEIPERSKEGAHFHFDCRYLLQVLEKGPFKVSGESNSLAWVKPEDVSSFSREESVLRLRDQALLFSNI